MQKIKTPHKWGFFAVWTRLELVPSARDRDRDFFIFFDSSIVHRKFCSFVSLRISLW